MCKCIPEQDDGKNLPPPQKREAILVALIRNLLIDYIPSFSLIQNKHHPQQSGHT